MCKDTPIASTGDWALVIEGGGMRGAYLGGVMGTLTLRGISADRFRWIYGVSAGASSGAYYIAGQVGLGFAVWKRLFTGKRFVRGFANLFVGRQVMDLEYLDAVFRTLVPINVQRIITNPTDFRIVITNCAMGRAEYVRPTEQLCVDLLKVTAAFPPFHVPVQFRGGWYADGALSDPIPIMQAIANGAKNILVVSTTPATWRASPSRVMTALAWASFPRNSKMRWLYQMQHELYNVAKEIIACPPSGIQIVAIQPAQPLPAWQLDTDAQHLTQTMTQGELDAECVIRECDLVRRISVGGHRPLQ